MRLVRPYRTEGEGRTQSGPPHAPAQSRRAGGVLLTTLLALVVAVRFVSETATVGRADSGVVVGVSALLSGLLVALIYWPGASARRTQGPFVLAEMLLLAAASLIATVGAPLLAFASRSSDAPPGSVVAFWTTAFAGVVLMLFASSRTPRTGVAASASLLMLVAGAGILTNWERPSSFSLLVRYTEPQLRIAAASLAWVVAVFVIALLARRIGWARAVVPVAAGPVLAGAVLLVFAGASAATIASPLVLLAAGASAVAFLIVISLGTPEGLLRSGIAIAAAPAVITLLTFVEAWVGMLGPRPILPGPVVAATGVGVASAATAVTASISHSGSATQGAPRLGARALAAVATVCAAIGLFTPGLGVAVKGGLSDGAAFATEFTMAGYETVAGVLVLALALLVLAGSVVPLERNARLWVLACAVVGAIAWVLLRPMPLHTWVSWIPAEVQQDYGTEFASIVFTPLRGYWQVAAAGLSIASAFVAVFSSRTHAIAPQDERAIDSEESS